MEVIVEQDNKYIRFLNDRGECDLSLVVGGEYSRETITTAHTLGCSVITVHGEMFSLARHINFTVILVFCYLNRTNDYQLKLIIDARNNT